MAETNPHSEAGKKILAELKEKGITDLDGLVRKITADKTTTAQARMLFCNSQHWCIIVKPLS
ncbi:MAG: hypothetical protein ACHQRJ_19760 [Alphaproteobacteria bacterium]